MSSTAIGVAQADDCFELYDLRVEVVCPPGERIMCGAKEGDHFTLEGEMMYLPPGQGISIYSLCELDHHHRRTAKTMSGLTDKRASIRPTPFGSEATGDTRQRLDDIGCADCLP